MGHRYVFEPELHEFIGLLCHLSASEGDVPGLHQGVVEKCISISHSLLKLRIPGLDSRIAKRGTMNAFQRPFLISLEQPQQLKDLESGYFKVNELKGRGHQFLSKPAFGTGIVREVLTRREYFSKYHTACLAVLEIYKHLKLRGLTLIDMQRFEDAGLRFLAGDLEIAAKAIVSLYGRRANIEVFAGRSASDYWTEIQDVLAAVSDKIDWLRSAMQMLQLAKSKCRDLLALRLLDDVKVLPESNPIFAMITRFYGLLRRTADRLKSGNDPKVLISVLSAIDSWLHGVEHAPVPDEYELLHQFSNRLRSLIAGFGGVLDSDENRRALLAGVSDDRRHIAICDIRGFTAALDEASKANDGLTSYEINFWFSRLRHAIKSWFIACDGKLSSTSSEEGDNFFGVFKSEADALTASSIAIEQLKIYDLYARPPLKFQVKIVLGKGSTTQIDGVELSTAVNSMFALVKRLCESKSLRLPPGSLLLRSSTLGESAVAKYDVSPLDEGAAILDVAKAANDMAERFKVAI